jgi:hypothetical protein
MSDLLALNGKRFSTSSGNVVTFHVEAISSNRVAISGAWQSFPPSKQDSDEATERIVQLIPRSRPSGRAIKCDDPGSLKRRAIQFVATGCAGDPHDN